MPENNPGTPTSRANNGTAILMDIDGTLTPPREHPLPEMIEAVQNLEIPFHVAAGSDLSLVEPQFLKPAWDLGLRKDFEAFVSNGATHCRCEFSKRFAIERISEFNFQGHLGETGYSKLRHAIEHVLSSDPFRLPDTVRIIGDQVIDRGSMLNFAPIGRPKGNLTDEARRNRVQFVEFDKRSEFRKRIRDFLIAELSDLVEDKQLRIMFGGETSFDLVVEGNDKTSAARWLLESGFQRVVFLGDALFEGGNDSVISDFIKNWNRPEPCPVSAIQVKDWNDTIRILSERAWE